MVQKTCDVRFYAGQYQSVVFLLAKINDSLWYRLRRVSPKRGNLQWDSLRAVPHVLVEMTKFELDTPVRINGTILGGYDYGNMHPWPFKHIHDLTTRQKWLLLTPFGRYQFSNKRHRVYIYT